MSRVVEPLNEKAAGTDPKIVAKIWKLVKEINERKQKEA